MSFDELRAAWQSQNPAPQVTIDVELLLQEVRRNQRQLESRLFWRDATEISVAVVLTVSFLWLAARFGLWSMYMCSLSCVFVGTFMAVDRAIQRARRPSADATLQDCIEASLMQVRHQIWLLTNIFWWYLLPAGIGLFSAIGSFAGRARNTSPFHLLALAGYASICVLIFWVVYRINMRAVQRGFEPRRAELESLLASLKG